MHLINNGQPQPDPNALEITFLISECDCVRKELDAQFDQDFPPRPRYSEELLPRAAILPCETAFPKRKP